MSNKIIPFTEKQRSFVRKAFLIEGVQTKFNEWIDKNLIYCSDTHSFVHRCYDAFKECRDYREAQSQAFEVLDMMRLTFLCLTYDKTDLKRRVDSIEYKSPTEILSVSLSVFFLVVALLYPEPVQFTNGGLLSTYIVLLDVEFVMLPVPFIAPTIKV